jgi:hypothetical protein
MTDPCSKVRVADGVWRCRVHPAGVWPCRVGEQIGDQLALLGEASPAAPAVIAEVIAERRYALDLHPPQADDEQDALSWIDTIGRYLERLAVEAHDLMTVQMLEGGVSLDRYRHRLVQTAGIAVAAAESIDRLTKG